MRPYLMLAALTLGLVHADPVWSQDEPSPNLTSEQILAACAADQADQLPNPFIDVQPTDWAYKSVLTLYYCGAYRGAIPPEDYQRYLKSQSGSDT